MWNANRVMTCLLFWPLPLPSFPVMSWSAFSSVFVSEVQRPLKLAEEGKAVACVCVWVSVWIERCSSLPRWHSPGNQYHAPLNNVGRTAVAIVSLSSQHRRRAAVIIWLSGQPADVRVLGHLVISCHTNTHRHTRQIFSNKIFVFQQKNVWTSSK